jgi:hypothetical protein
MIYIVQPISRYGSGSLVVISACIFPNEQISDQLIE